MNKAILQELPGHGPARRFRKWYAASLMLLLFQLPLLLYGQEAGKVTVTGKILSSEDNLGLPGASIKVKGTTAGTVADMDGGFSVEVTETGVLEISAVGFETQDVPVQGREEITITLSTSKANTLNDVVVVGYGTSKKKDLTGSVSSVKIDELRNLPQSNLEQMLQGKVAGVTVGTNSGAPGSAISVRIRGVSTIGNNEPLYVIDGVMIDDNSSTFNGSASDASGGQTRLSPMSLINPQDIESIDILKDASAAAIYGSRASNGVVIITTKKGKAGEGKISYDFYYGRQSPYRYLSVLNLKEYAAYSNNIADISGNGRNPEFQNINVLGDGTDWQREVFRPASMMNHQLSFSGGNDKSKYYISGGYFDQDGILVGSGFKRYTGRFNGDHRVKNWLKVGSSLTYAYTDEKQTLSENGSGVVVNALRQTPNVPVRFPDGSFGGPVVNVNDPSGMNGVVSGGNPVAQAELIPTKIKRQKIMGNVYADVNFLNHFTLHNAFGMDVNTIDRSRFTPTYEWGQSKNEINSLSTQNNKSTFWQLSNYLTYTNDFGKHSLTAMVGHEAQRSQWEWLQGFRQNFPSDLIEYLNAGDASTATNTNGAGHATMESYFGRLNYGYANRYLFTFNIRRDASSKFGPGNQAGYFPSVSGAWVFSEESFLKPVTPVMTFGKIRIGYGTLGNQASLPQYAFGTNLRSVAVDPKAFGSGGTAFFPSNISNPDLKWESQHTLNLGLDLVFLDRINLTIDLYDKRSKDFLYQLPLPYYMGTGVPGQEWYGIQGPWVNTGEMQNKGFDISLNADIIRSGDFTWNLSAVFSRYRNKLLSLLDGNTDITQLVDFNQTVNITKVGEPVGQFYGWQVEGIFQTIEQLETHATQSNSIDPLNGTYLGDLMFKDQNGDGVIDGDDRVVLGSPHPEFTYGFTNTISYKGFDLSFFFNGSYGSKLLNYNRKVMEAQTGRENQFVNVRNSWTPENTNTDIPRYIAGDPNNNSRMSDRYIEDGSFFRLQNLTLGYTLPASLLGKTKYIQRVRAYAGVQNVFTITRYSGYDPDLGAYNGDALRMGIDYGHYPTPRTFTIGANVEF